MRHVYILFYEAHHAGSTITYLQNATTKET